MAEPLIRKTFAKLRARRRKSFKGIRNGEPEVLERLPVSGCSEAVQIVKCECADPWTEKGNSAGASWGPSEPSPAPSASGTSVAVATCPGQDPGAGAAAGWPAGGAGRVAEGGGIWYNPIPEDDIPVRAARRPGSSRAQWYVEAPAAGEGAPQHAGVAAMPSGAGGSLEQRTPRCDFKSSPGNTRKPSGEIPAAGASRSQCGSGAQKAEPSDGVTVSGTDRKSSPGPSPRPPKKSSAAHRSLSDRVKSPGTVRRLSMKMKKLPELRRKLSLRGASRPGRHDNDGAEASGRVTPSSPPPVSNVICRYHLDSSVSGRWRKQRSCRAPGKAGYLSDGDSPELVAKAGKAGTWQPAGARLDTGSFRPYGSSEQLRCLQYLSGLLNVRLYGIEGLRLPRAGLADVFCAIQVDSVSKARTAVLTCQEPFLSLDHTFNIELEHSQLLKLLLYSWDPSSARNRLCCHGTAVLPPLFKGARTHQLAMKLEPRGVLYLKVSLVELWEVPLCSGEEMREPTVFRVELGELVEREKSGVPVPLLIQKCVSEIERRGLKTVGLYRLCGSAAVKKELRDSFERDSSAVNLSEEIYPDINVITGILKDYLRELPSPLITKALYEVVLEAMSKWPLKMTLGVPEAGPIAADAVSLLDCLPEVEKATLTLLLDHLSLVASLQELNKMTCQNLAVCFGPVLLGQKQESSHPAGRSASHSKELTSALDFKRHIEVLHYLLQLWPGDRIRARRDRLLEQLGPAVCLPLRRQKPSLPQAAAEEVVCRNRVGRAPSSSRNRHAGDWSSCGRTYLGHSGEAVSQVPALGLDTLDRPEPGTGQDGGTFSGQGQDGGSYPSDGSELDFEMAIGGRSKDFDSLIADIERELAKKIIFL